MTPVRACRGRKHSDYSAVGRAMSPQADRMNRSPYLETDAHVSSDGLYRYWLSRRLSAGERVILFVGLNPSTADALQDDHTIRRCAGFARRWGFDWLHMGNLHAWRSTDPKGLPSDALVAVGSENHDHLKRLAESAEVIVAAWGRHKLNPSASSLARWVLRQPHTRCLGINADGSPKHPRSIRASAELVHPRVLPS